MLWGADDTTNSRESFDESEQVEKEQQLRVQRITPFLENLLDKVVVDVVLSFWETVNHRAVFEVKNFTSEKFFT